MTDAPESGSVSYDDPLSESAYPEAGAIANHRLSSRGTPSTPQTATTGSRPQLPRTDQPRAEAIPTSAGMLRVPTALRDSDSLMKAARTVAHSPIVDHDGAYCGTVSAHCVAEALADGEHDGIHVSEVIDLPQHCARSTGLRAKITRRRMEAP